MTSLSLRTALAAAAILFSSTTSAKDSDGDVTTTRLLGSQSFSSADTSAKAVNDQDVVDMRDYADKDAAAEALKTYQQTVSLVVGRRLDPARDGSVKVLIDADGGIEYNAVIKHSGDAKFDKAMVKAVKEARVPAPPEVIQDVVAAGLILDL
jgi:hypothetical protein